MIRAVGRSMSRLFTGNLEIIVVSAVLIIAQPWVPAGTLLARDDLAPWLALSLSLVTLVRGGRLGPGPHPMLPERHSFFAGWARQIGLALVPWVLLYYYDAARLNEVAPLWIALGSTAAVITLLSLGRIEGQTAWNPPGPGNVRVWGLWSPAILALALGFGLVAVDGLGVFPPGIGLACLLSLQFVAVGLAAGRTANLRQRLRASRTDRRWLGGTSLALVLAVVGPGLGYFLLAALYLLAAGHPVNFGEAYVITLFVSSWGAILWRRPQPVAVACLLHEVVPQGGKDAVPVDSAIGFEMPPEGALRLNPLRIRRARTMHPWIVPVRRARIGDLDDPVKPLWNPAKPLAVAHILGEAAFEPDATTGAPQWDVMTIRLAARGDLAKLSEEDAQARRIVILRPFPRVGGAARPQPTTYRWEERLPTESLQVLDATTETCQLVHGDLIVMSSEGVARAYELEVGSTIWSAADLVTYRTPQVEDYTRVR